jgi:cytochrome P450
MSSLSIPSPTAAAPLVPGLPVVGNLFNVWRDPLDHLMHVSTYGEVASVRFGPMIAFLLNAPDAIHHVLVDNNRNYTKSPNYAGLKLILGEGLVTSEGDFWRRQRKLAQPAFQRDRVNAFAPAMIEETDRMLDQWESRVGEVIDAHAEMMKLTLRIVTRTLFGTSIGSEAEAKAVGEALTVGIHYANDYAESLFKLPGWIPSPKNRAFKRAITTLDALVYRIIEERRSGRNKDANDLLALYMAAVEDGRGMTDRQLRDEVMTLVMAGHETTANALAWTFYLLSKDPEVERRMRRDVAEGIGDAAPRAEDLPRIKYVNQVLQESMRLYPPAWIFERQAIEDDVILGYRVPKRAIIAISPFVLHRQRALWENPEGFDPDRFAPGLTEARPRFAYLPFGAGPRQCIGMGFAMMEAQLVLARIAQRFRLELVPAQRVTPEPVVTLRPKEGLPMRLRRQSALPARASSPRDVEGAASSATVPVGCPAHGKANGARAAAR